MGIYGVHAFALGSLPIKLSIQGRDTGFLITTNPYDLPDALTRAADALTEAGYVLISGNISDGSSGFFYRNFDNTNILINIIEGNLVIEYAHYYNNEYKNNSGDGSGYGGLLFDSSYYDAAVELYRNDVPNLSILMDISTYMIDIEGRNSRLTYYYITDDLDALEEFYNTAMETAGFWKDGALYTNGLIGISLIHEPLDSMGFTDVKVIVEWVYGIN
jgi:hypothetical protein